jgi:RHS repeat-associated protein
MSIQKTAPPAPFTNDDVETSDLDFDKRMDVVQSTDAGYTVWFNVEEGKYSRKVQTGGASYQGDVIIRFSHTGVHLEDLNGDRMNDVARIRPTHVIYCASMGHGHFDTAVEIPIPDAVLTDGTNGQVERAELKDVNGDGLADLVVERAQANELWYWLNLGTDAFSGKHVITDMPTVFGHHMVTRWADINGNGTTDLIYADSTATSRLVALDIGELAGGSAHPNLLIGVDNGLGVRTGISYRSNTEYYIQAREAGQPWSVTIPFPVSVIAQVKTTTGLDVDMVPGVDEYVKTYSYRDGFYEDREKAFRGFAEVTVTELGDATAPTRVSTHSFFTGGPDGVDNDDDGQIDEVSDKWHREEDALKGKIQIVAVRAEGGFLFSEEKNDWLVRNLAVSTDNIEVRFAYNQERQKLIYEGTATPETLRTTFVYDDFGNVTEARNYGALSITGDEAFSFAAYINDTNLWILGLPQRQYITNESLQTFSETLSYYDGADYTGLLLGQVAKGNLMRQQSWVEGSTYVNLIRNAHDVYGNITGILDPNGNQRTITYESTFHAYPVQEDIEVGGGKPDLSVIAAYNLGLGVVTSSTGFNGHQTSYGHDTFGRLTSIVGPGDSAAFPTLSFSYTMADPENGLVYDYDAEGLLTLSASPSVPSSVQMRSREISGQAGTFDTIQYVDGMGRKLASVEEGETDFIVKEAVLFNAMGTVHSTFLPYSATSSDHAPPLPGGPAAEARYDAAGREILRINPPDAENIVTSASTAYLPLLNTVTDENSNSQTFFYDGLERLIAVHEQNQGQTYITQYAYDPLGHLLHITDAQNNVKTVEYDGLSRKIALNDPDRGRMQYTYDDAGNIIQTIDNRGQTIIYMYDGANRLLTADYQDAAFISPDVAYHYDWPSSEYPGAENTKGKLSWVEDLSGGAFFSYDARGNTIWSVKRITDAGLSEDFLFLTAYDAMDRVVSNTYPDGDRVEYTYNHRSLLKAIPGLVNSLDYFPSGQLESITYANGLTTTYAYDPRTRMTGLVTDYTIPTGSPIQDLSYTFDGVSNIMAITDNRTVPPGSPENATQAFQYDHISRLTRAQGPGYGAIDFDYDKIGNMIFKGSPDLPDPQYIDDPLINLGVMASGGAAGTSGRGLRLPGEPPGPHAVTSTESGLAFDYDDNGNMTDHEGDVYEWDFKDRLVRTTTADTTADYVYDFSGQRVIKKSQTDGEQKVVYYPSKGFEIRDGKPIKYVFDGSRRIARIEGRLTTGGQTAWQVLNFRTDWNFFSLEVEPDDPAIDAALASLAGNYSDVWTFDAASQQYVGYVPAQGISDLAEIHAQQGYIIHITTPTAVLISGTRATNDINLEAGWNLIACPADSPMAVIDALSSIGGKYTAVWTYDTQSDYWRNFVYRQPDFVNNLNSMQPGKAYWIYMTEPAQLAFHEHPTNIYYYHPDHLGSSSVVTDDAGSVVERTEFYPFGRLRHEQRDSFHSAYKFTGKERDKESGLFYYGARYYEPVVGKFVGADPAGSDLDHLQENILPYPQRLNVYAYVANNPFKYIDPDGLKLVVPKELKKEYAAARKYLISKSPHAAKLLKRIEESKQKVVLSRGKFESFYDPDEKTIEWDPNWGQRTKSGKVQSPSLVLAHEISHALREMKDPHGYSRDIKERVKGTDPPEEKRVILGDETIIARQLGEPTRREWEARPAHVRGPTSRISKQEFESLKGSLRGALQLYKQGEISMKEYEQITHRIREEILD